MKKTTSSKIGLIITFIISSIIIYFWFFYHLDAIKTYFVIEAGFKSFIHIIYAFFACSIISILFYLYIKIRSEKTTINIKYSFFIISMALIILTIFLFNVLAYLRMIYPLPVPIINIYETNLAKDNLEFIKKLLMQIVWIIGFILNAYILGYHILKNNILKEINSNKIFLHLNRIGIGLIGWVFALFILGIFNLLYAETIFILIFINIIFSWKIIYKIIKSIFKIRTENLNLNNAYILITIFCLSLFFSLTLITSMHSKPGGFDDATAYLNKPKLIAEKHSLVPGGQPFPFEILNVPSFLIGKDAFFAYGVNIAFAMICFLSLIGLIKSIGIKNRTIQLMIATAWLSLPLTEYFISQEIKVEILLFFISALAIWNLMLWLKKGNFIYLGLSFLFLGFSITIKLSSLILMTTVVLIIIIKSITDKDIRSIILNKAIYLFLIFLIPFTIWIFYVFYTDSKIIPKSTRQILYTENNNTPKFNKELFNKYGIDSDKCNFTAAQEDLDRYKYTNNNNPLSVFLIPWEITMNKNRLVKNNVIEIGFIFIIFVILLIIKVFQDKLQYKTSNINQIDKILILGLIIYWILWKILAKNVIWYGYPGFALLLLVIAIVLKIIEDKKIQTILKTIILIQIVIFTLFKTSFTGNIPTILYITHGKDLNNSFLDKPSEKINSDPGSKVYVASSTIVYFINNSDSRVLNDNLLDNFNCLYQQKPKQTLEIFRNIGIKYIVYNKWISGVSINNQPRQKVVDFLDFAKKELRVEIENEYIYLFSIP